MISGLALTWLETDFVSPLVCASHLLHLHTAISSTFFLVLSTTLLVLAYLTTVRTSKAVLANWTWFLLQVKLGILWMALDNCDFCINSLNSVYFRFPSVFTVWLMRTTFSGPIFHVGRLISSNLSRFVKLVFSPVALFVTLFEWNRFQAFWIKALILSLDGMISLLALNCK